MAYSRSAVARSASSELRIGVPTVMGRFVLAPAVSRFLTQHPQLRLRLTLTDRPVDPLRQALDATVHIGAAYAAGAHARRVATVRKVVCASHDFLAYYGEPRAPGDLDPANCIGVCDAAEYHASDWLLCNKGCRYRLRPSGRLLIDDYQAAVSAAVSGAGFVCVWRLAADAQIAAGLLQPVLTEWSEDASHIWLTCPEGRHASAEVEAVVAFLRSVLPA